MFFYGMYQSVGLAKGLEFVNWMTRSTLLILDLCLVDRHNIPRKADNCGDAGVHNFSHIIAFRALAGATST